MDITIAHTLLQTYQGAMSRLEQVLDDQFCAAVEMIANHDGHLVICGMGKSGLVGAKIAALACECG